ncbi:hypothetical protein [Natronorubrum sp. FCH18a]|uniref:hypothetical protein n=1 Tax=Natronorubrum sp. FCH18a TaxID=3447018 RepID=UPI003F516577
MSSGSADHRLSAGVRVEFQTVDSTTPNRGRITEIDGHQLLINWADETEWIDQEQITSILERNQHTERMSREDVPEKPGYELEIDENVDASLADALKTAAVANEGYLEALLAAELASFRLERGAYDR